MWTYNYTYPDELYHHGILGQKWGVRRYQNADGSLTTAGKNHYAKKEQNEASKNRRTISDQELDNRIARLKKEKELKRLTTENNSPGKAWATKILSNSTAKVAGIALSGAAAYGLKYVLTNNFDVKEFANYVAANPNKKK